MHNSFLKTYEREIIIFNFMIRNLIYQCDYERIFCSFFHRLLPYVAKTMCNTVQNETKCPAYSQYSMISKITERQFTS